MRWSYVQLSQVKSLRLSELETESQYTFLWFMEEILLNIDIDSLEHIRTS